MVMLQLLLLSMAVSTHGAEAQTTSPKVKNNHYAVEAKALEAKMTQAGVQIKNCQHQIDTAKKQLELLHSQSDDEDGLVLNTIEATISDRQKKLSAERQLQAKDLHRYRQLQPKMGLYHINYASDFHKAKWIQPWYVKHGTEVGRFWHLLTNATSTVISPIPSEKHSGFQEKARLNQDENNKDVFESQPDSDNYIHMIVVSESDTWGCDDYIMVTFSDGGEIAYKQPRDRMRADHDMWVRTYDWGVGDWDVSYHRPARDGHGNVKQVSDYPDALLLMRPQTEGDSNMPDLDLTYTTSWETAAKASGIIGSFVLGVVGLAALAIGAYAGSTVCGIVLFTILGITSLIDEANGAPGTHVF